MMQIFVSYPRYPWNFKWGSIGKTKSTQKTNSNSFALRLRWGSKCSRGVSRCWARSVGAAAEETQPYDHDATLRYVPAEASPCSTHGGEAVHVAYPPSPPVPKVPQEEDTRNKSQEHDDRTTETPFPTEPEPKDAMDDLQGKQLEPPTPPVLPGCLDKNFKCPVVMLEHDVRVMMATGFTKEMAEEALVKARGSLPEAMGLLIRARYGIPKPPKPDTKELQNRPEQKVETTMEPKAEHKVEAKGEPTSPSPMDIVAAASPVTRRDQREFRGTTEGSRFRGGRWGRRRWWGGKANKENQG